jgi:hypothetical protein
LIVRDDMTATAASLGTTTPETTMLSHPPPFGIVRPCPAMSGNPCYNLTAKRYYPISVL